MLYLAYYLPQCNASVCPTFEVQTHSKNAFFGLGYRFLYVLTLFLLHVLKPWEDFLL